MGNAIDAYAARRLGDLPAAAARRWGAREAVAHGERRWTHAAFAEEVDRVAKGLIGLGVDPGDKVGLWMTNRAEWLFTLFVVAKVGVVLVPLNTRYRAEDVAYTVEQSDTTTLIINDRSGPVDYSAMVRENLATWTKLKRLVVLGDDRPDGALSWEDLLAAGAATGDETLAARLMPCAPRIR